MKFYPTIKKPKPEQRVLVKTEDWCCNFWYLTCQYTIGVPDEEYVYVNENGAKISENDIIGWMPLEELDKIPVEQ